MIIPIWPRFGGWSRKDKALFYKKMSSAKNNSNRSHSAREKAQELLKNGNRKSWLAAADLLKESLIAWPSNYRLDTESTYDLLGDVYRRLGDYKAAEAAYEHAITWEKSRTTAYLNYPEMIVTHKLTSLYPRALDIVNRAYGTENAVKLEVETFIYHAVRAVVFYEQANPQAQQEANLALAGLLVTQSAFTRHPTVGLVPVNTYKVLIKRLKQIQASRANPA